MDEILRKLIRPQDARGPRGQMSRGKNVYDGTRMSPTSIGTNSRTGKKARTSDYWTSLAEMRMKGII